LTLLVGRQEGHLAHKKHVPLIPKGSVPEQVEEETDRYQLTQELQLEEGVKTDVGDRQLNQEMLL